MTEQHRLLIGLAIAIAGGVWYLLPSLGRFFSFGSVFGQGEPDPPEKMTRVEVFANCDELRKWFEANSNTEGVAAMNAACSALICKPKPPGANT